MYMFFPKTDLLCPHCKIKVRLRDMVLAGEYLMNPVPNLWMPTTVVRMVSPATILNISIAFCKTHCSTIQSAHLGQSKSLAPAQGCFNGIVMHLCDTWAETEAGTESCAYIPLQD